ncbi:hypothetical protein [Streptomyces sp. NPDC058694]|uniref:hypothetical protein n=1 Tax=Streptomyces sp. NPDC058694 TaxID=3346603 RepID=UPI00365A8F26
MNRLLKIAGPALSGEEPNLEDYSSLGSIGTELHQMRRNRNGFYAFESALHVFSSDNRTQRGQSIAPWNAAKGWLDSYGLLQPRLAFFAEDVFGGQFGTDGTGIYSLNPETAALSHVGTTLREWAERVLDDYAYMTGYPVAHEWQSRHGEIPAGHRLIPRIPFVFGGAYSADNMILGESVAAMRYWGKIANSIAGVSDGAQLTFDPSVVLSIRCAADGSDGSGICRCFAPDGGTGVSETDSRG